MNFSICKQKELRSAGQHKYKLNTWYVSNKHVRFSSPPVMVMGTQGLILVGELVLIGTI